MGKFITNLTNKYVKLESSGKTGFKYYLYGWILKLNKKKENKQISNKWFWFYGRFHLPPYWWRTKTFKAITVCLGLFTVCFMLCYFLFNNRAEQIVKDIDRPEISVVTYERSNVEQSVIEPEQSIIESEPEINKPGVIFNKPVPDVEEYTFLRYDLSDAMNKNSDTVAWLEIPYCNISYPVVQGKDNDYYLKHDFYGNYTYHGWVFQDYRDAEPGTRNIVVYGHNLIAGGMFSNLSDILNSDKPVYVKYQSTYDTRVYEVISIYVTEPVIDYIQMNFTDEEFVKFEENIVKQNQWGNAPKVELNEDDKFLTLSTCYGDNRLAVHCRLVEGYILSQN